MSQFLNLVAKALQSGRPEICDDVAVWARKQGLKVWDINGPTYEEILPLGDEDEIARLEIELHRADYERPQSLVIIPNARVRDQIGLVFLCDGSICYQGNWFRPYLTGHPSYQARFRKRRHIKGDVFSLLGLWSDTFYHWFHDTLPRLWTALPYLPPGTRFLIHEKPRLYQLESLDALGISGERLILQTGRGDSVLERLWFATPVGHSTFSASEILKQVAAQLKRSFGLEQFYGKQRIYISRRAAAVRRILNEVEIEPILKRRGFQVYVLEDLPFRKQVEICASANTLIGPHGAGLTHLLFCAPKSKIGEIALPGVFPHYLGMARQLGHSFTRFIADKSGQQDMTVNPSEFERWLAELLMDSDYE